ncbi:MAG: GTPase [Flavobacteriaceae bacterium]|nr:GTPase [Flavobacteriaceae bacterium]
MKLIFVYNANSGPIDKLIDGAHKIVSPKTYDCHLCAITFGAFTEDDLWKSYREHSPNELHFYHKDEFEKEFRSKWLPKYDYPVILTEAENNLEVFLPKSELTTIENSEALIEAINERAAHY